MTSNKPTDADIVAAFEGRGEPKLSDLDFSLDTQAVTETASALDGYDFSMGDTPDPFKVAADARIVAVLDESAAHRTDPLWMERSEVNMAAESYAASLMRRYSASETLDSATRRAERARDKYMAEHRAEHATEAALLEATATHLTRWAALDHKPATPSTPVRASAAPAATPSTRTVRLSGTTTGRLNGPTTNDR